MLLIFVDLDALKEINDRLGHAAGDQALVDTGTVLKSTFRERDIVARLGGDEFVVLVTDSSAVREADLLARLSGRLGALNARAGREFQLALSIGVAAFDPGSPESLEELSPRPTAGCTWTSGGARTRQPTERGRCAAGPGRAAGSR